MATSISDSLLEPTFTEPFVMFVIGLLALCFWLGIRLYSVLIILGATSSFAILMSSVFFDLSIVYFYFSLLMTVFSVAIASIRYTQLAGR